MQRCIKWIQKYYVQSTQINKQQFSHRLNATTTRKILFTVNDTNHEIHSEEFFWDLERDTAWRKTNQV